MKITNSNLKQPEAYSDEKLREFAGYVQTLGNPQEAALKLGVKPGRALQEGIRLMNDPKVRRLMGKRRGEAAKAEALAGLRRLAFGRINDALTLLSEDAPVSTEMLDLFNVSEIKRVKGGGVEIKFFDRLEALERLSELEQKASDFATADNFFAALQNSTKHVQEDE